MQDPLSNAVSRAKELKAACSNVEVELLDAGHCPHDEVPHLVNYSLLQFMQQQAVMRDLRTEVVPTSVADVC